MNILIIEDDHFLAWRIAETFSKTIITNQIIHIASMSEFYATIPSLGVYDIVLVDLELPPYEHAGNGYEIIEMIRKQQIWIPIVVFSGNDTIASIKKAFSIGANDYIIKPIRLKELELRIENWFLQYRHKNLEKSDGEDDYHGLIYQGGAHRFIFQNTPLHLTKKEKYLLFLFFMSREKLLTKNYLIEKLWGDHEVSHARNISAAIMRLKGVLSEAKIAHWLENIRGEGYIFACPKTEIHTMEPQKNAGNSQKREVRGRKIFSK